MRTYKLCKSVIMSKNYDSVDEMMDKLDAFLLRNRITQEQYEELTALLQSNEAE